MGSRGFLRHKMIVEIRAKQRQKQKAARLSSASPLWLTEEHTASSLGVTDRKKKEGK